MVRIMKREEAYYGEEKVQGNVPCSVKRHEARRNEAHKRSGKPGIVPGVPQYRQRYA